MAKDNSSVGLDFILKFKLGGIFMKEKIRAGCEDIWNAFMIQGVEWSVNDIPLCPTTAKVIPENVISFAEAKTLYNKHKKVGEIDFFVNVVVHFYIDDQKFDGKRNGIWIDYTKAVEILQHFAGIITPDFSTCLDFPVPLKLWNTYRMRAFGYWYGKQGGAVINNVRWGTEETFQYCFDGIEKNSIVAIGTVASNLQNSSDREIFVTGFEKMLEVLSPHTIIIYGSDRYSCFNKVREKIVHFRSQKDLALRGEIDE